MIKTEQTSNKNWKVTKDGAFLCWIKKEWYVPSTGLNRIGHYRFYTMVNGTDMFATTLTALKTKIEKAA